MKICIDAVGLLPSQGGFSRYVQQLIDGLSASDAESEYVVLRNAANTYLTVPAERRFATVDAQTPARLYTYWGQVWLPLWKVAKQVDLWHSPVSVPPLWCPARTVITVHDLSWERIPSAYPWHARLYWKTLLPIALRRAAGIIAVSESTKRDLMEVYGVAGERITVVYLYVSVLDSAAVDSEPLQIRYTLPHAYILYVGQMHPRKNVPCLLRAFRVLKQRTALPHKLVLVGPAGGGLAVLQEHIRLLGLEADVIVLGTVPDSHLAAIYRAADLFVFPSLHEGFGYPPLEAMAHGVPTIVSNAGALPEVVGDAALQIDPTSSEDLAQRMLEVLSSTETAHTLRTRGLERVREFSMEKMVAGTLEVYRRALSMAV